MHYMAVNKNKGLLLYQISRPYIKPIYSEISVLMLILQITKKKKMWLPLVALCYSFIEDSPLDTMQLKTWNSLEIG
jgi:hypothetical protein